ncbi:uroporphyrinogen-III synthase [Pararhizobium mangrovi]|uniref:Uroporphyrinogen-III synthase n=1 Tax=Pararhizobium mangrovi TaxID=2590452 RepID=A0A506U320_9HYPH|nr:uroporphyrinogen-III synthase [Pararhizobium mangrovi]TPW27756.1 uroporphyrinogen-III synthase [Pararhizobium mangrovi]
MRVLVTRPEPDAQRTAERLRAAGFEPIVLPVSRRVGDPAALEAAVSRPVCALALTSRNAARVLAEAPAAREAWHALPVFTVGEGTAAAAREAGFDDIVTSGGTGEALAATIARLGVARETAPLAYCAGRPRSVVLEGRLAAFRVPFIAIDCYAMESVRHSAQALEAMLFDGGAVEAAVFYSAESAKRFFALLRHADLSDRFAPLCIPCMSERVAAAVPERFRAAVCLAERPEEGHLLEILAAMRD